MKIFKKLFGVPDTIEQQYQRFFIVMNYGFIYAALAHAVMAAGLALMGNMVLTVFNAFSTLMYIGGVELNRQGHHLVCLLLMLFEVMAITGTVIFYFGANPGFTMFYFALALVIVFYPAKNKLLRPTLVIVLATGYATLFFFGRSHHAITPLPPLAGDAVFLFCVFLCFALLALAGFFYSDAAIKAEATLVEEHARSEHLLHNVLPVPIAKRLKEDPGFVAEHFDHVSIVFADIVGFTPLSEKADPKALVSFLNQIVSRFDKIADDLGMEKIKTIGDAYMVVAGLPIPRDDHARAATEMALAMQQAACDFRFEDGAPISLRIGIHSGPVVAGVIGQSKFIYDLWGDTVNTASRMESHGVPGKIQTTQETRDLLHGLYYTFEERGEIAVKGKGLMKTWFIKGREAH